MCGSFFASYYRLFEKLKICSENVTFQEAKPNFRLKNLGNTGGNYLTSIVITAICPTQLHCLCYSISLKLHPEDHSRGQTSTKGYYYYYYCYYFYNTGIRGTLSFQMAHIRRLSMVENVNPQRLAHGWYGSRAIFA